jgi:hypothetical protein
MRAVLAVLAAALAVVAAAADEPKKEAVRAIQAKGLQPDREGAFNKPLEIADAEALAKVVPDEAARAAVAREVDFKTEKLVLFRWAGSGGDKLAFTVEKGKEAPEVVFTLTPGLTKDLRPHVHLYAVPKAATFKVQTGKP